MNRRSSIKGILAFVAIGTSAFSVFKWIDVTKPLDVKLLYSKKTLIDELTEVIIPRTDTPGAKDAKVGDFVIKMIVDCTEVKTQNKFINGLLSLEKYVLDAYRKSFIDCNNEEKKEILTYLDHKSVYTHNILNRINSKLLGESFFLKLRDLTVLGYCTSEIGATKGLAYDYIPGKFEGCILLTPNQKSWATK